MGSKKLKGHKSQGKLYSFAFPQVRDWEGYSTRPGWISISKYLYVYEKVPGQLSDKKKLLNHQMGVEEQKQSIFFLIFAYHQDLPINL